MWHENVNLDYFELFGSTLNIVLEASASPFPQPNCAEINTFPITPDAGSAQSS